MVDDMSTMVSPDCNGHKTPEREVSVFDNKKLLGTSEKKEDAIKPFKMDKDDDVKENTQNGDKTQSPKHETEYLNGDNSNQSVENLLQEVSRIIDDDVTREASSEATKTLDGNVKPTVEEEKKTSENATEKSETKPSNESDEKSPDKPEEEAPEKLTNNLNLEKPTNHPESPDYEEALHELKNIARDGNWVNEEELSKKHESKSDTNEQETEEKSRKRPSSPSYSTDGPRKKVKGEEKDNLKKMIKKLTRKELEDLVAQSMAEVLSTRSELGALRRQCQINETNVEKWEKRAKSLQKQCQDLGSVMKKYITDIQQAKQGDKVTPIKITRSVGLQVNVQSSVITEKKKDAQPNNGPGIFRNLAKTPVRGIQPKQVPPPIAKPIVPKTEPKRICSAVPPPLSKIRQSGTFQSISSNSSIANGNNVVSTGPKKTNFTALVKKPMPISKQEEDVIDLASDDDEEPAKNGPVQQPPRPVVSTYLLTSSASQPKQFLATSSPNQQIVISRASTSTSPATRLVITNNTIRSIPNVHAPNSSIFTTQTSTPSNVIIRRVNYHHPAPLPTQPIRPPMPLLERENAKAIPPKPTLGISEIKDGIVLSWNMNYNPDKHAEILSHQIFAYQETFGQNPSETLWKKVGEVKALPLPMACTLTQFKAGHKYHFAVRPIDVYKRLGPFSEPESISLSEGSK